MAELIDSISDAKRMERRLNRRIEAAEQQTAQVIPSGQVSHEGNTPLENASMAPMEHEDMSKQSLNRRLTSPIWRPPCRLPKRRSGRANLSRWPGQAENLEAIKKSIDLVLDQVVKDARLAVVLGVWRATALVGEINDRA